MQRLTLVMAFFWSALICAAGFGAARLSDQQARALATKFATATGMTWGTPTRAELRTDVNAQRKQELRLGFRDRASIGLDPVRGVVTSAGDYAAVTALNARPTPARLDRAAALARAQKVVKAARLEGVLRLEPPTVMLQESGPGVFTYFVLWRPTYRHIPYDSVALQVNVSAVDGRLLTLSTGLDVRPPRSTKVSVSRSAAITSATALATRFAASFRPAKSTAELRIVTADSYWAHYGLGRKVAADPRVAWVVELADSRRQLIFWIDAADGRLLGGAQSQGTAKAVR